MIIEHLKRKKKTKNERSGLTSSHSFKLRWWQPAGLFASWTTNRREIESRDWALLQRKEHVQIPPKTSTNIEEFITESSVNVEVTRVNKTNVLPCKWLYETRHFTKNQVNICIELVPCNPLLTYHQHNPCLWRLSALNSSGPDWSMFHLYFLIIVLFVYIGENGAKCCFPAISICLL